ncbi:MAG: HEAT repeat domain-containing protein [bacterium]
MSKKLFISVVTLLILLVTTTSFAFDKVPVAKKAVVEKNLFAALESGNKGLQKSAIYMLGNIGSDRAVLPLLSYLKYSEDENVRIAAAWSLCQIGDARGLYAVKQAVSFDPSLKVRNACAWHYEVYVKQGTFRFAPGQAPSVSVASK